MHTRELVELAAIVSAQGPVLVGGTRQLSTAGIDQYWTASKCRIDRWGRSLKTFSARAKSADARQLQPQWPQVRGVLEEILTGEVLTRVWTAVLCAWDRRRGTDVAEPIARSVMLGHLEARHRVLTLLVNGPGIDAEQAVKLNYLRRRCERWTDLLVGYLSGLYDVAEFTIDPRRAADFAEDLKYRGNLKGGRHAWPLVLGSLRSAFQQGLEPVSPNADLNGRIAAAILACFQPELFDSTGIFRSLWLLRLMNAANDAQGMIDDLLAPAPPADDAAAVLQSGHRWRRLR